MCGLFHLHAVPVEGYNSFYMYLILYCIFQESKNLMMVCENVARSSILILSHLWFSVFWTLNVLWLDRLICRTKWMWLQREDIFQIIKQVRIIICCGSWKLTCELEFSWGILHCCCLTIVSIQDRTPQAHNQCEMYLYFTVAINQMGKKKVFLYKTHVWNVSSACGSCRRIQKLVHLIKLLSSF